MLLSSGRFLCGGLGGVIGFFPLVDPGLISEFPDDIPEAPEDFRLLGGDVELLRSLELWEWNVGDLLRLSSLELCRSKTDSFIEESSCEVWCFIPEIGMDITSLKYKY